jgi:catechol 2,3-dioxygenase
VRCLLTLVTESVLAIMSTSSLNAAGAASAFATHGPIHLAVTDRDRSVAWWRAIAGLQIVVDHGDSAELGVEGDPIVVLRPTARYPVHEGYTGLYHFAINLPDEVAFAQTLARLLRSGAALSTTDHIVAKSMYVVDPDGIAVELTVETPERVASIEWPETATQPNVIDVEGRLRHGLEPLDVEAALAKLPAGELPRQLASGTRMGHVHLKVSDLDTAYSFYRDGLGFLPENYAPLIGYADLGTGDFRVHRIAVNTWQGAGLPPRPAEMAGMEHFTLRFDSQARLDEVLAKVEAVDRREGGYVARDPSGNAIALLAA